MANSVYQNALRKKGLESQSNVCRGGASPLRTANIKAESLVNKKFTRLSAFSGSAGKCSSEHVACGLFGVLFTAPKKYSELEFTSLICSVFHLDNEDLWN